MKKEIIPTTDEVIRYVTRYGGDCRDCADESGLCPNSGLPCDFETKKKAIMHVLSALKYGHEHGYITLPEGWQPIETAPKDAHILLFGNIDPETQFEGIVWTRPAPFSGYWDDIDKAWVSHGTTWDGPFMQVTHWMPLPKPPSGAEKQK